MHAHDFKIFTSLNQMKDPPRKLENYNFMKKKKSATSRDDIVIDTSPPPPRDAPPGGGDIELRSPTRRDYETKRNETK